MKSWIPLRSGMIAVFVAFVLGGSAAGRMYAQDQQQQDEDAKPKPAAHAPMIDTNDQQDATNPDALRPDNTPLTGVQSPGLGSTEFRHSYWVPGVQVATTAQNHSSDGGWFDTTYLAGNLSLLEAWAHSRLTLNYSGGGYLSTDSQQGNGAYQNLGFTQEFDWQRWQLQFFDQFTYLPTSQFGFGGLSGISTPGIGGSLSPGITGLGGNFVPSQTVFTNGPRYSNSFATQATFMVTRRASMTFAGSYGILRFTESGNIDNDDVVGNIGYNYELSKKDTIGLLYRYSAFHFSGLSQAIGDHVFNLAYGRKITGRLALSLFAGPEITTFRVPIGTDTSRIAESFGATLSYGLERGNINLSYTHGTSGGSGVLAGATGDNLDANATRRITRLWNARGNFGYGRTHGFETSTASAPAFNNFYLGAGLDRPIGRNANVSFGYTAYIQNLNQAACGTCSTTSVQHQVAVGFQWHTRPFVLR